MPNCSNSISTCFNSSSNSNSNCSNRRAPLLLKRQLTTFPHSGRVSSSTNSSISSRLVTPRPSIPARSPSRPCTMGHHFQLSSSSNSSCSNRSLSSSSSTASHIMYRFRARPPCIWEPPTPPLLPLMRTIEGISPAPLLLAAVPRCPPPPLRRFFSNSTTPRRIF